MEKEKGKGNRKWTREEKRKKGKGKLKRENRKGKWKREREKRNLRKQEHWKAREWTEWYMYKSPR